MLKLPIYLDNNATTPCDPRVVAEMVPYFTEKFGNAASRNHRFGWEGEDAVEKAREQVAKLIGADSKEIIFTSGATEGDNLAVKGVFEMYAEKGKHFITVKTEHKAVLDAFKHIEKLGAEVTYLNVNQDGLIEIKDLKNNLRKDTVLVAIMYANNETGVIQNVKEISKLVHENGSLFFSDATQAVGKIPVDVTDDGIDILTFSAHKMYGPKGIGAVYVRRKNPRVKLTAQMDGGGHERGMRSGTLNVPGIVGFGKACELCLMEMKTEGERLTRLRNKLEENLLKIEESHLNGNKNQRLPHVANISFKYVEGEGLLMGLSEIALSSGSACTSASLEPSYVLKNMGLDDELAHSSLRFGLGRFTKEDEIDFAIEKVKTAVSRLREMSPLWEMFKSGIDLKSVAWQSH